MGFGCLPEHKRRELVSRRLRHSRPVVRRLPGLDSLPREISLVIKRFATLVGFTAPSGLQTDHPLAAGALALPEGRLRLRDGNLPERFSALQRIQRQQPFTVGVPDPTRSHS